ncbi:MAG: hypothetical protein JWP52_2272, partial [Rhizobacter sp.]|nr:hypothetical protein [Rhizobacter sp.]
MLDSGSPSLLDHLRFLLRNTWRRRRLAVAVAW